MKRLSSYLCCLFFLVQFGFSQSTKIAEWTFESPGGYTTSIPEFTNTNLNYFTRTDGSNILQGISSFNNIQDTYFFAAANVDDEPDNGNNPVFVYIDDIDISGYTNLEFRVHLAEDNAPDGNEDWDNTFSRDYVHFDYDIDNSGTFDNLLWIEATTFLWGNQPPQIDTDFNEVGDGAEITDTFTQFTHLITGTGSLLDIRIEISLNLSQEDIAIDNIEIWGDPPAAPEVDWCNLQYPPSTTINFGDSFDVYGRVYEPGVTDTPASQGAGISAWIGFSATDATSTNDFTSSDWTWVPANYNAFCPDCNDPSNTFENNDEYFVDIGSYIPGSGTYYYVTRFQLNGGPYIYGGYTAPIAPSPSGGGFWDGVTNVSQILTVLDNCIASTTWDGLNWSNVTGPDLNTEAILNGDYETSIHGNFEACSLTVNSGILRVQGSGNVLVKNNIIVDGTIIVASEASLVQVNDTGTVTVGATGNCVLQKTTTYIDDWFDYTYWSSPVSDEEAQYVFSGVPADRIYRYDAANYDDSSPVDGFDDDGNDWIIVGQSEILLPGKGYAAVADSFAPIPSNQTFTFNGSFNNGVIEPMVTVSAGSNPKHWNFLGNPYPSGINADLFLGDASNTSIIGGTIYLWTHNSDPEGIYVGTDALNFTSDDYASYNLTGGVGTEATSADTSDPFNNSTIPTGIIASGQGFFVEGLTAGVATFNNSMRVISGNDNFFRMNQTAENSTTTDRLWLNLENEHGAFSQILIGFNEQATNGIDRLFDGKRLSANSYVSFYSLIGNEKFAIQGLEPFSENITIPLGIHVNIEEDLPFTISIDNLEGILESSNILLRDNFLNSEHNLSNSAYTFTSEVGEFNERFEIWFANTLSVNDLETNKDKLIIKGNENNEMEFSTTNHSRISNIKIFDLLGRQVLNSDFDNQYKAVLDLSTLETTIYIANVTLDSGRTLTQKILNSY